MVKIIMKNIPSKHDFGTQYTVMKNWSAAIVQKHMADENIQIFSVKEIASKENDKKHDCDNEI